MTHNTTQMPAITPPNAYAVPTEPGYIMTLRLGSNDYQIFAYTRNGDGTKNYLPSSCNPQVFERIRGLTWGLINAHEARRASLNEAPFEINTINTSGLKKRDNNCASHDFLIQPLSSVTADQMASAITLAGQPMQAGAVKAQDVYNTLNQTYRQALGQTPHHQQLSPPPPVSTTPLAQTQPPQPNSQVPDPAALAHPSTPQPQTVSQIPAPPPPLEAPVIPLYRSPVTATSLNLPGLPSEQQDWYDRIPPRSKLRIVTDILDGRFSQGGIYEKVWKLFESKVPGQPPFAIVDLLTREKRQLALHCRTLPSPIPAAIRHEANQIITAFQQHLVEEAIQEKIVTLMEKEFERKEELFQCIQQQARAEGVVIEDWDRQWAQFHFIENTYRFAQALARWLDNN